MRCEGVVHHTQRQPRAPKRPTRNFRSFSSRRRALQTKQLDWKPWCEGSSSSCHLGRRRNLHAVRRAVPLGGLKYRASSRPPARHTHAAPGPSPRVARHASTGLPDALVSPRRLASPRAASFAPPAADRPLLPNSSATMSGEAEGGVSRVRLGPLAVSADSDKPLVGMKLSKVRRRRPRRRASRFRDAPETAPRRARRPAAMRPFDSSEADAPSLRRPPSRLASPSPRPRARSAVLLSFRARRVLPFTATASSHARPIPSPSPRPLVLVPLVPLSRASCTRRRTSR